MKKVRALKVVGMACLVALMAGSAYARSWDKTKEHPDGAKKLAVPGREEG